MKEYIPILFSKALAKIQFRSPSATLRIDSSPHRWEPFVQSFASSPQGFRLSARFLPISARFIPVSAMFIARFRFVSARFLAFCKVLAHFRNVIPCLCKVHRHLCKVRLRLRNVPRHLCKVLYIVLEIPTRSLSKRWIGVAFAANWIIGVISTDLNLFSCIYWLTALIHS